MLFEESLVLLMLVDDCVCAVAYAEALGCKFRTLPLPIAEALARVATFEGEIPDIRLLILLPVIPALLLL